MSSGSASYDATVAVKRHSCPPTPRSQSQGKPRYEVVRLLSQGGMAEVYLANQNGPGEFVKQVAVKKMRPDLGKESSWVEMFLDEARLAARLNHPNIVRCFELEKIDGDWGLVMDYLDGVGLDAVLSRAGRSKRGLPLGMVCRLGLDVLRALDYAHELADDDGRPLNIIHRDIAPGNVFVMREGSVVLLDFGIARASTRLARTAIGCVRGKVGYMAPEQWLGGELDQRVDVWGVGVLLWEALVVERLIPTADPQRAAAIALNGCLPPVETLVPDVPPALAAIISRALQRDPAHRYQSAGSFRQELRKFVSQAQVNAGRDGVAQYLAERHADHWGGELQEGVNATGGARSSSASARSAGATGSTVLDSRLTSGPSSVLARVKITPRWRSWMGLVLALWALFLVAWLAPNQAWPVAVGLNLIVDALPVTDSPRPLNLWPVRPLVVDGGDSPGDDGSVIDCGASEAIGDQAPDEAAQPGGALASPHQPRQRGRRSGRVVRRIRRPGCAGPRAQRSVFCRGQTEWGSLPPPAELNESFLPPTWARR